MKKNRARGRLVILTLLGLSYALGVAVNDRQEMAEYVANNCPVTSQYVMNGE